MDKLIKKHTENSTLLCITTVWLIFQAAFVMIQQGKPDQDNVITQISKSFLHAYQIRLL